MTEMTEVMTKFEIKSPDTGNELSQPESYNLMFRTGVGTSSESMA